MHNGQEKPPMTMLILSLVTCNIFTIVWMFQTADDINKAMNEEVFNPVVVLISSLLCGPLAWYWGIKLAQALPELQKQRGLPPTDKGTVLTLLFIFFAPVAVMMYQEELNKVWKATPAY